MPSAARALLRSLGRGLLDLVFAPVCAACRDPLPPAPDGGHALVCAACWARTRAVPRPRCERCGTPRLPAIPGGGLVGCTHCPLLPPALRAVRSALVLHGPARELVHALKYGGWSALAEPMARRMAAEPLGLEAEEEVRRVVAVPTSAARVRERGYNQSALLAREVARIRGWECLPDALVRARSTGSQTALHPTERRANVAGAFAPAAGLGPALRREHVLLIDDVWTTGATALACCDALLAAGARAVSVLTFTRALPELNR